MGVRHWAGIEAENMVPPLDVPNNKAAPLKHLDMLGHGVQRHLVIRRHFRYPRWHQRQPRQNGAPGGVGERVEGIV